MDKKNVLILASKKEEIRCASLLCMMAKLTRTTSMGGDYFLAIIELKQKPVYERMVSDKDDNTSHMWLL